MFLNLLEEMPWWFWFLLIVITLIKILNSRIRHIYKIIKSYRRLNKLKSIEHPGQQFAYLRKIDPFVFEEMILTSFKRLGGKIIRNRHYTGDGGIDGKIVIDNQLFLIQAKRYSSHINPAHITDFARLCERQCCRGLFIHTGKTGAKSWKNTSRAIDIVSGQRMLDLLNNKFFVLDK